MNNLLRVNFNTNLVLIGAYSKQMTKSLRIITIMLNLLAIYKNDRFPLLNYVTKKCDYFCYGLV